jgi:hypothetical protein
LAASARAEEERETLLALSGRGFSPVEWGTWEDGKEGGEEEGEE